NVLRREHLPRSSHAGLYFIDDQDDSVLGCQISQALQEGRGWNDIAALSLNRLDDDRGDFVWSDQLNEQLISDEGQTLGRALIRAAFEAIRVRIRRVIDAREQRTESAPLG